MFKKYQRLKIAKPYSGTVITVYYLTEYIGLDIYHRKYPITIILCEEEVTNKIYHIEASSIVEIINGVNDL